jgi:hypothetical protein
VDTVRARTREIYRQFARITPSRVRVKPVDVHLISRPLEQTCRLDDTRVNLEIPDE